MSALPTSPSRTWSSYRHRRQASTSAAKKPGSRTFVRSSPPCAMLDEKLKVIDTDFRCTSSTVPVEVPTSHGFWARSGNLFLLKCLVTVGQEHVLCLDKAEIQDAASNGSSLVKSTLYILVKMIESSFSYNDNGSANSGKAWG